MTPALLVIFGFYLIYALTHFATTAYVMLRIVGFQRQLITRNDVVSRVAPMLKEMNTIIPGFISDRVEIKTDTYVIYTRTDHLLIETYQDQVIGAIGRQISISYDIVGYGIVHIPRIYKTEEFSEITFYEEVFIGNAR